VEYKCLFGSKCLGLCNCYDEDWAIITDKPIKYIDGIATLNFPFYNKIVQNFINGRNAEGDAYKALFLYQLSNGFHSDANYPFEFNILEHKENWTKCLKSYVNLPRIEQESKSKVILTKKFYHLLYQYYMITEDTHFISDEARAKVQKIHDLEMPSSFFYELRELINTL
jgi:hypothetical protein